jgi:DNA-binding transcriptional regulator LsrR (DeoR family)
MTRANHPSDRAVAEASWLYYVKNLTQGEIAKQLGLSRPTVIAYLRLARERQIVSIRISGEHFRVNALADTLRDLFNLKRVMVVPERPGDETGTTLDVCEAAAHYLPTFVGEGDVLGVSWGETVHHVSENLPFWPVANLTVRQLLGSLANPLLPTAESCATEIARRLSGNCVTLNAPAICTTADLASRLKAEPIIAEQMDRLAQCGKAIYSLSPCTADTHVVQFKLATPDDISDYLARGAVGIITGRFIDAAGDPVDGPVDDRLIGIDLETLRTMEGLLVVSGTHKTTPTLAALRGGYADHLVLDAELAQAVVDMQEHGIRQ